MRLFVVDPHPIFRNGLAATLGLMPGVDTVAQAASPEEALGDPSLARADLVLLDCTAPGGMEFIATVRERTEAAVLICTADAREPTVFAALREGARGYITKDAITQENLGTTLRAVAAGSSVIGDGLLGRVVTAADGGSLGGSARDLELNEREHGVLSLIADGLPTREIALELCYSERTVKNVLHDVVTKLGVRSRSQAVATAVRAGLI